MDMAQIFRFKNTVAGPGPWADDVCQSNLTLILAFGPHRKASRVNIAHLERQKKH